MTNSISSAATDWEARLSSLLPLFGHRNWIVVADSAYPAQSKDGIETIVSGKEQLHVVRHVLDTINSARHIRANVWVDQELAFVSEIDAPGVEDYRRELKTGLHGARAESIPHEQLISRIDESAQVFRILIIKTDMTIPYTSVFFELDCEYWNAEAEQRLRQAMLVSDSK
jgi:D-ribose pyranose/furanose isomerase RbsD